MHTIKRILFKPAAANRGRAWRSARPGTQQLLRLGPRITLGLGSVTRHETASHERGIYTTSILHIRLDAAITGPGVQAPSWLEAPNPSSRSS